jgi:choice-of-anchor A domain-containing protein
MRGWISGLMVASAVSMGAATAEAAAIPASTLFADFNVIDNTSFASTSEVVGPLLIGGTVSAANAVILNSKPVAPLPIPVTGLGEVNVFGNVVGATVGGLVLVGRGSVVLIGGTNPASPSSVMSTFPGKGAGSVLSGNGFPFNFATDIWGQLTGVSANLATLAVNGTNPTTGSSTFTCPGCTGAEVWKISATALQSLTSALVFPTCLQGPHPSCDGVVDVTGTSFRTTQGFVAPGGISQPGLIFNFETATSVTVNNAFEASILAPDANLQSSSFIEGNVVANGVGSTAPIGAEIHEFPFDCSDNLCDEPPPVPAPEPGSLALLGAAFAFFAALLWHRRQYG